MCTSIAEKKTGEKDVGRSSDSFVVCLQRLLSTVIHSLIKAEDVKHSPAGLDHNVTLQRVTDLIRYGVSPILQSNVLHEDVVGY